MRQLSLSVFFPTYNEEANIARTVRETVRTLEESPYVSESEVIVVNDGSKDRTAEIVQELMEEYPNLRLVNHERNQGYGAALVTGLGSATKEYVFFTDADLQFDLNELQHLLSHATRYDAVIGYRAPRRDSLLRLFYARGWNLLNRLLFGLRVRDIDCAFKLFRTEVVQDLLLRSRGAMISAELLIRLFRGDAVIKQIPVTHLPRLYGTPTGARLSVIFRALSEMVTLYRTEFGSPSQLEVVRFAAVGVVNTLIDLSLYVVFSRFIPIFADQLVAAKFLSFMAGTVSSLLLNRRWTFGLTSPLTVPELARFYASVSIGALVNVGMMSFLLSLHVYDLLALILTTGLTFVANFALAKFWVFRRHGGAKPLLAPST